MPEVQISNSRPTDQTKAVVYDIVCARLRNRFQVEELKRTGIFKVNFTNRQAKLTNQAGAFLQVLAKFAPVGSEVLALGIEAASNGVANRLQRKDDQALFLKTVEVNLLHLAIAVALKVSEYISDAHEAGRAVNLILEKLNNISQCPREADLVEFLVAPVLQQAKAGSSNSSSTPGFPLVAYYDDGIGSGPASYAPGNQPVLKPKCCVIS